jgi:hypothetical protein
LTSNRFEYIIESYYLVWKKVMNERIINDLAVKSGLAEDMGRGYKFPDNYLDFAEMIVRRCAAQIAEAIPDTDCSASGAYKTAKIAAMAKVKDHFGVEE